MMKKGQMVVVLALFLSLFFSQGVMGQGLYDLTGRYSDAEPLLKRAIEIREKTLGKEMERRAVFLLHGE